MVKFCMLVLSLSQTPLITYWICCYIVYFVWPLLYVTAMCDNYKWQSTYLCNDLIIWRYVACALLHYYVLCQSLLLLVPNTLNVYLHLMVQSLYSPSLVGSVIERGATTSSDRNGVPSLKSLTPNPTGFPLARHRSKSAFARSREARRKDSGTNACESDRVNDVPVVQKSGSLLSSASGPIEGKEVLRSKFHFLLYIHRHTNQSLIFLLNSSRKWWAEQCLGR